MNDCIIWKGAKTSAGYGAVRIKQRNYYVHRLILAQKLGRHINQGYQACHTCDNPACINPEHLFEGTQSDNMKDMANKGRYGHTLFGESNPHSKLTAEQVAHLRQLRKQGRNTLELANQFGITRRTVQMIVANQLWKHTSQNH